MTPARPRVSSGNGRVMMLAYRMMCGRFLLRTRMRSPAERLSSHSVRWLRRYRGNPAISVRTLYSVLPAVT